MGKENEKTGPETKRKAPFCQTKKKNLAESDKGSWFGETAEDPERSKTLLAQVLSLPLPLASLPIITWSLN